MQLHVEMRAKYELYKCAEWMRGSQHSSCQEGRHRRGEQQCEQRLRLLLRGMVFGRSVCVSVDVRRLGQPAVGRVLERLARHGQARTRPAELFALALARTADLGADLKDEHTDAAQQSEPRSAHSPLLTSWITVVLPSNDPHAGTCGLRASMRSQCGVP